MKAENQLQYMMDFQGSLFYNRQKCLDQLFCTIGNGFHWLNGELVENNIEERAKRWKLVKDIEYAEPDPFVLELGLSKERQVKEICERRGKTVEDMLPKWYPLCEEYSYICNYPKDIKPDWLNLINECKQLLEADGIKVPENRGFVYE